MGVVLSALEAQQPNRERTRIGWGIRSAGRALVLKTLHGLVSYA
jgi:hypothetical protein